MGLSRMLRAITVVACAGGCDLSQLTAGPSAASGDLGASAPPGGTSGTGSGTIPDTWLAPEWSARRRIVIHADQVAGPLDDFVVFVNLAALQGGVPIRTDGHDIRFAAG